MDLRLRRDNQDSAAADVLLNTPEARYRHLREMRRLHGIGTEPAHQSSTDLAVRETARSQSSTDLTDNLDKRINCELERSEVRLRTVTSPVLDSRPEATLSRKATESIITDARSIDSKLGPPDTVARQKLAFLLSLANDCDIKHELTFYRKIAEIFDRWNKLLNGQKVEEPSVDEIIKLGLGRADGDIETIYKRLEWQASNQKRNSFIAFEVPTGWDYLRERKREDMLRAWNYLHKVQPDLTEAREKVNSRDLDASGKLESAIKLIELVSGCKIAQKEYMEKTAHKELFYIKQRDRKRLVIQWIIDEVTKREGAKREGALRPFIKYEQSESSDSENQPLLAADSSSEATGRSGSRKKDGYGYSEERLRVSSAGGEGVLDTVFETTLERAFVVAPGGDGKRIVTGKQTRMRWPLGTVEHTVVNDARAAIQAAFNDNPFSDGAYAFVVVPGFNKTGFNATDVLIVAIPHFKKPGLRAAHRLISGIFWEQLTGGIRYVRKTVSEKSRPVVG